VADTEPGVEEVQTSQISEEDKKKLQDENDIRRVVADVHAFVRSRELNKSLSTYSFDHYLEEAKLTIGKEPWDPNVPREGARLTQFEMITKLEADFDRLYAQAEKMAETAEEKA